MQLTVRVNGILAQKMGLARFTVVLIEPATLYDLRQHLQTQHPHLTAELERTVAVVDGRHQPHTVVLQPGQEVALLLPVAGG